MSAMLDRSTPQLASLVPVLIVCLLPVAGLAFAGQAQQEASIIGQVTDTSGAILPGVTVTATSPALQVSQLTNVTNERGEYRLSPLPIGTYAVEYTLAGFQTVRRENIPLTAGFIARIDVTLKVGALAETITVSGAAPVVDVTSTNSPNTLTRDMMELIPTSRAGLQSVLVQAPGARTNLDLGSGLTANPIFRVFGRNYEAWIEVEGFPTTSPKSVLQSTAQYFDYESFEQTTVSTLANNAESPNAGMNMNIILKSGGNDFHGQGTYTDTNHRFSASNLDANLTQQGIKSGNPIQTRWDADFALGGPIISNRLWFFYSGRVYRENTQTLGVFQDDGSPAIDPATQLHSTEKVSYQISPSNKLIGFSQAFHRHSESGDSLLAPYDSRQTQIYSQQTSKLEWQVARGNKFVSIQAGEWAFKLDRTGFDPTHIATFDQVTQRVTGQNIDASTTTFENRKAVTGTVSWYKPDWFFGNHAFKAGFAYWDSHADRRSQDRGAATNMQLVYRTGVPFEVAGYNYPVYPYSHVRNDPLYIQDSWTLARRLTLNLGIRYDHDWAYLPQQCRTTASAPLDTLFAAQCFPEIHFPTFNPVTPRVHAAFDLTGDGKTVIKGGWGRFAHMWNSDEINMANKDAFLTSTFLWHAPLGSTTFTPGQTNFDPQGPDFVSTSVYGASAAIANAVPNPNLLQMGSNEWSASVERQLVADLAVRVTGVYSKDLNTWRVQNNLRPFGAYNIPIAQPIPGPNGVVAAGNPLGTITFYEYSSALAPSSFQQPMLINDSSADQTYKSFEVAASKRLTHRWMLMASYSATKLHQPYITNTMVNVGSACIGCVDLTTYDPNAQINTFNGTWDWLTRISGTYIFPWSISSSVNYENRSNTAWARQVSFAAPGQPIPSILLNVEPIGTERLPSTNLMSLRVEKAIPVKRGHKLMLRANIYNALNSNTTLTVQQRSGATYGNALSIVPPRIAEFGLAYTF
jgi:hypothetical protein